MEAHEPTRHGRTHPSRYALWRAKEGRLRAASYEHLRTHAGFVNGKNWAFPHPVGHTTGFGLHIYGRRQSVSFQHASQLYGVEALTGSLKHDGSGELPGIKHKGDWDLRPHARRIVHVDTKRLTEWNSLSGNVDTPASQTPLLAPVTDAEEAAISALSSFRGRLALHGPRSTIGMFENLATKRLGLYEHTTGTPGSLSDVILQGPHLGVATPFAKQPKVPCNSHLDWSPFNLTSLPVDITPRSNFVRA